MSERYTLEEAAAEFRRRECRTGHSWDVTEIRTPLGGVLRIVVRCSACGWNGIGDDPSWKGTTS